MTPTHRHTLAALEQQIHSDGVALCDVDTRIAEVLDVPPGYYFAYLLVVGAIEARGAAHAPDGAGPIPHALTLRTAAGALFDRIAWQVCRIYQLAGPLGRDGIEIALIADELLGLLAEVRRHLDAPVPVVGVDKCGAVHHRA
jgi:hypothetical protein